MEKNKINLNMDLVYKIYLFFIKIPFILKGGKISPNSFLSPGYGFFGLHLKGVTIGKNVAIGRGATLNIAKKGAKIIIQDGSNIARYTNISSVKKITIGKKCLVSYNTTFLDHDHVLYKKDVSPLDSGLTKGEEIIIKDNCFIGAHCFILKGVTLGKQCVVGANSVVNKSFPDYSVIAGNPAKLIKKIK